MFTFYNYIEYDLKHILTRVVTSFEKYVLALYIYILISDIIILWSFADIMS